MLKEGRSHIADGGWKAAARRLRQSISAAHDVMAVPPRSLTVVCCPMAWLPDIVRTTYVITGAVNIVRPIANFDCHRTGITATIIGAASIRTASIRTSSTIRSAVVRPVSRRPGVIAPASTEANRDGD